MIESMGTNLYNLRMTEFQEIELKASLAEKLSPAHFPNVSATMFACLGALLNERMSEPQLASIVATSDGWLLGRAEWDAGFNETL